MSEPTAPTTTTTTEITVTGMTCGHCVSSVTEELQEIDGVTGVDVDLESGAVRITSTNPLDDGAVKSAVADAGYAVA